MNQEKFSREVIKKFKMKNCAKINTLVECGIQMLKNNKGETMNSTIFKSLVGSLRYLTCTCTNILFVVRLISRFIKTHLL